MEGWDAKEETIKEREPSEKRDERSPGKRKQVRRIEYLIRKKNLTYLYKIDPRTCPRRVSFSIIVPSAYYFGLHSLGLVHCI